MPATPRNNPNWTIVCDFDGTIAFDDVTDRLLEKYAAPEWQQLERDWAANAISSRDCLMKQTELLAMTADELNAEVQDIQIDPAFADFLKFAESRQCTLRVASEGYTQVIRALLNRAGTPPVSVSATYIIRNGRNHWMLGTPFSERTCATGAATCKCTVATEATRSNAPVLVIGDGRSDFCVAAKADFVFARGKLLEFCREKSLPHVEVTNFRQAREQLTRLLEPGVWQLTAAAREQRYG
ncbi:MAG: MtnX-like HAD-IB family phosphatase [Pseudomonadota bacterium]